ncbi:hypothetical protein AB6E23_06390 [Vibrio cyclitrophicus]
MISIIKNTSASQISLDDLIVYLDKNVDFNCQNSILSSAEYFGRLFLNKNLLQNYILKELKGGLRNFESENKYTPPSIMLHASEKYLIRANLWRPVKQYTQSDINLYGLAHDHNFDFLTLNYKGPGYTSKMYTYDYKSLEGIVGEPVVLRDNGILKMEEGDMYLYRKNYDVHSQLPPEENSITLNLMASLPKHYHTMQYIFDVKKKEISKVYGNFYSKKHIFDMAELLDDDECNEVLQHIHKITRCEKTQHYINAIFGRKTAKIP